MKIAISASSDSLDQKVNPVFGRCAGFLIVETENGEIKSHSFVQNNAVNVPRGAGIAAAQTVIDQNVQAAISGNIGPNAFSIIQQAGTKFYPAFGKNIKQAVKELSNGQLKEKSSPSVGPNYGMGRGQGKGRGMGRRGRGKGW